ncbi:hypothetical protein TSAR_003418 [Trichomalopsis sarcophagae]|uniref:Uncharacterized protein n=1 Tax=Trichomalopsis sarcophagae TaxID=543379 RepID=A0A232FI71_9HYME|nr:hypothetical protein TSAR_003418 [Trichomalopsis sarcophagae]
MAGATNKRSRDEAELGADPPPLLLTAEDVIKQTSTMEFDVVCLTKANLLELFVKSGSIKAALFKAVDLVALQLKVKRVTLSRETPSLIIDGDSVKTLLNYPAL